VAQGDDEGRNGTSEKDNPTQMNPDPTQPAQEQGKENNPDAICGHCGKPFSKHFHEDETYCFKDTTGDTWTDEPGEENIGFLIQSDHPDIWERFVTEWKQKNGHRVTPTHAPATEGQTGETPETDQMELHVLRTIDESANQRFKAACDFARKLEAQRDSARAESAGGPPEGWPAYAENLARKLGEMTRERDNAIATHAELEAQVAAMRGAFDKAPHDPSCKYPSLNPAHQKHCTCWKFKANKAGTSGQALLDRLKKAEEDSKIVDYMEHLRVECEGRVLTLLLMPGDETIRQRASAMRKDGHE
jgi:hypothetical protein